MISKFQMILRYVYPKIKMSIEKVEKTSEMKKAEFSEIKTSLCKERPDWNYDQHKFDLGDCEPGLSVAPR